MGCDTAHKPHPAPSQLDDDLIVDMDRNTDHLLDFTLNTHDTSHDLADKTDQNLYDMNEAFDATLPPPITNTTCSHLGNLEIIWDRITGAPALIRGSALQTLVHECLPEDIKDKTAREIALAVLKKLAKIYRMQNDVHVFKVHETPDGRKLVHFEQVVPINTHMIKVLGSRLTVILDSDHNVLEIIGRYWPIHVLPTLNQNLVTENIIASAQNYIQTRFTGPTYVQGDIQTILAFINGTLQLGTILTLTKGPLKQGWILFVAHENNEVSLIEPLVYEGLPEYGFPTRITGQLNSNEGGNVVGLDAWLGQEDDAFYLHSHTDNFGIWEINASCDHISHCVHHDQVDWGAHDTVAITAGYYTHQTLQYFEEQFNRQGWDDEGGYTYTVVRYPCIQANAFYLGNGIVAFASIPSTMDSLATRDFVAHEITHGVIESTADLIYHGESGALNESFADIFSILMGVRNEQAMISDPIDWVIGNVVFEAATRRDLSDPKLDTHIPLRPSLYQGENWIDPLSTFDYGGVHVNSAVQSYFFYLLLMGGEGNNEGISYNIRGIGFDDAETLAYRVLTERAHPTSDYESIRLAWIATAQAIDDERFIPYEEGLTAQVQEAWKAVGLSETPCVSSYRDQDMDGFGDPEYSSDLCIPPVGYVLNTLDCDDTHADRAVNVEEICGDAVINDCTLTATEACGDLSIEVMDTQLKLSWNSDCVVQILANEQVVEEQEWMDVGSEPQRTGCYAELLLTADMPQAFFRLRLP